MTTADSSRSAFFYGTLMAPEVLHRVCHGPNASSNNRKLQTHPAILNDHRRHRVKEADYPAITPHPGSIVRGTHVSGLTDADIWRLDIFEGSEYRREKVSVHLLDSTEYDDTGRAVQTQVEAETYIWTADPDELDEREWDFAEFQREKMRFWVGKEGAGEYAGRPSIIG